MFMDITWQDPVTGTHGFVVIDTLVRGSASGDCGCAKDARSRRSAASPRG